MAHTPGPWSVFKWAMIASGYGRGYQIEGPDKVLLASMVPGGSCSTSLETTDANARLIAAAPDLLAVCQEIARMATQSTADQKRGVTDWSIAGSTMERVRAAIAKAEGK